MNDLPDPLAGRDPHPREQIDTWPLHDARQELLEEIVSQPGAGSPTPPARRVMVPVGIAAALVIVAGGAWALSSGDGGSGKDDQVVAATSDPTTVQPTEPAAEPSEEAEERDRPGRREVRVNGVQVGKVRILGDCPRTVREGFEVTLRELGRPGRPGRLGRDGDRWKDLYVIKRDGHCQLVFGTGHRRPGGER